ncbi:hypothetical protein KM1_021210 [Entamoeba histolytica HM-3:IMSS]|uniref:Uncharacterized protein n=1 Tax=Entamoeba histolytica HM-3:IMSS TaxID=885315 RepID=M7WB89_ENTHI|nr:hypothetical protein KM1_021210 [Entamoeba histolytica HM-3:IMSS]
MQEQRINSYSHSSLGNEEETFFSDEDIFSDNEVKSILYHLPFDGFIVVNPNQRIYTNEPSRCENAMFKHRL